MVRKINTDPIKTALVKASGVLLRTSGQDIDERLGELLADVQKLNVYGDGKTFVDLVPSKRVRTIKEEYALLKKDPDFDLREFLSRHFYDATDGVYEREYIANVAHTPLEHTDAMWDFFERRNRVSRGSLLALPHAYVVPGGRFNEQFYWDSYFIMLGLASAGKWNRIEDMMKNYAYQIRKYGYIPTANRSYLLSRSQPPFFSHMVRLLANKKGNRVLREYLPYLTAEYRFWMKGQAKLKDTDHKAYRRIVQMPDGSVLNRYYDNKTTPRPESLREDVETAEHSGRKDSSRLYLHIRAAAESGWDFSSRWFLNPTDIKTIHTSDIIPTDLNSLLYHLELTIADGYKASLNLAKYRQFIKKAKLRQESIEKYLWSDDDQTYMDYNFHHSLFTPVKSLAAVFPLYVGLASKEHANLVAKTIEADFLKPGGLVSTTINNGQQWDAPNGWAPLHWAAIEGFKAYNNDKLAEEITQRWTSLNERVFAASRTFVEKYNVESEDGLGAGGEYVLQDGFGWTNGVYAALKRDFRP